MTNFRYQIDAKKKLIRLFVNERDLADWIYGDGDPIWVFDEFRRVFMEGEAYACLFMAERIEIAYKTRKECSPREVAELVRNYGVLFDEK